jgi:hypothetical protein
MTTGTRLAWAVQVRMQSDCTRFRAADSANAPIMRVRGFDAAEGSFALVGDTPRGRLGMWFDDVLRDSFRKTVSDLPTDAFLLVEGKDELWRTHRYRVPVNQDVRAWIAPLLVTA